MENWKQIKLTEKEDSFHVDGKHLFGKYFKKALKFHDPGLAPVQDETGWYHINAGGNAIYEERYDRTFGFYCNRAAASSDESSFHINHMGKRFYGQNYGWVGNYQEGKCVVRDYENNYFHINLEGTRLYSGNHKYAGDFKDGYACVKTDTGWMHINDSGNAINGKLFTGLGVFHKGFATARDEKGWFHIDKDGKAIYPERYGTLEPFYNGIALAFTPENKMILIGENGELINSM